MTRKWIVVSLALLILASLLGWWLHRSAARFTADNDISKLQPTRDIKQQIPLEVGLPPFKPRTHYTPEEFGIIPAQNLFAESRSMQKEPETTVVDQAPKLNPRPALVGVTISGNQRVASVLEPTSQMNVQGGSRRAQTKRLGDVIQGYTIVDITESQLVLAYGNQREIIPLYDTTKQRSQGGKTPIIATRVVNFSPGSGGTGTRITVAGGAPPPPGVAPAGTVATTPSVVTVDRPGAQGAVVTNQPSTATRQAAQPTRPTPGLQQQAAPGAWNERVDEQGRRIIRTPFGDIVRDKPPVP